MDFDLTDEQRALRDSIHDFASRELNEDVVGRDKTGTFSREAWQKCADMGLLGLPVPERVRRGGRRPAHHHARARGARATAAATTA